MIIIGICGGIAAGKSTLIKSVQKKLNIPVFFADEFTAKAYQDPGVMTKIAKVAPAILKNGKINKKITYSLILQDNTLLSTIEKATLPFICKKLNEFILLHRASGTLLIFLEIPLLFTNHIDKLCTKTINITSAKDVCKRRALKRESMTEEFFEFIYKRQQQERLLCKTKANFIIKNHDIAQSSSDLMNICNNIITPKTRT